MRSIAEWFIGGMATTAEGRFYTLEDGLIIAATQFKITLEQERSVGQRVDRQLTFGAKIIDLMGMYMPIGHKISCPVAIVAEWLISRFTTATKGKVRLWLSLEHSIGTPIKRTIRTDG